MKESKSNGFFAILILFNFLVGVFNILSGDFVLGLLFLIFAVTIMILDLVSDIIEHLKRWRDYKWLNI